MTREEAIKQLKQIIDVASKMERNEKEIDAFDEEALNMAIKELEQELCDDAISRQAALDALAKNMPLLTTPDGCGEFDHDIQVTDEAYVDCMQIIHELPSVQSETVRCEDCKHRGEEPIADGRYWCEIHDTFMYYCSDAERRIDE